jgi:LPPG:FO 2-phospho-L-lactate transferase
MADACLTAIGVETSASGVAHHYGARIAGGLLDGWLVADEDASASGPAGVVQRSRPLLMTTPDDAAALAGAALDLAVELRR